MDMINWRTDVFLVMKDHSDSFFRTLKSSVTGTEPAKCFANPHLCRRGAGTPTYICDLPEDYRFGPIIGFHCGLTETEQMKFSIRVGTPFLFGQWMCDDDRLLQKKPELADCWVLLSMFGKKFVSVLQPRLDITNAAVLATCQPPEFEDDEPRCDVCEIILDDRGSCPLCFPTFQPSGAASSSAAPKTSEHGKPSQEDATMKNTNDDDDSSDNPWQDMQDKQDAKKSASVHEKSSQPSLSSNEVDPKARPARRQTSRDAKTRVQERSLQMPIFGDPARFRSHFTYQQVYTFYNRTEQKVVEAGPSRGYTKWWR